MNIFPTTPFCSGGSHWFSIFLIYKRAAPQKKVRNHWHVSQQSCFNATTEAWIKWYKTIQVTIWSSLIKKNSFGHALYLLQHCRHISVGCISVWYSAIMFFSYPALLPLTTKSTLALELWGSGSGVAVTRDSLWTFIKQPSHYFIDSTVYSTAWVKNCY